jgi:hypothetical protein
MGLLVEADARPAIKEELMGYRYLNTSKIRLFTTLL